MTTRPHRRICPSLVFGALEDVFAEELLHDGQGRRFHQDHRFGAEAVDWKLECFRLLPNSTTVFLFNGMFQLSSALDLVDLLSGLPVGMALTLAFRAHLHQGFPCKFVSLSWLLIVA